MSDDELIRLLAAFQDSPCDTGITTLTACDKAFGQDRFYLVPVLIRDSVKAGWLVPTNKLNEPVTASDTVYRRSFHLTGAGYVKCGLAPSAKGESRPVKTEQKELF